MKIEDAVFVYRLASGDRLSWHGRYHAHGSGEFEIHFFLEGSGYFLCNRTKYPVSAGRLFLSGPREFHSIVPDAVSAPLTYYAILFSFPSAKDAHLEHLQGDETSAESTSPGEDQVLSGALKNALAERQTVLSINNNFRFQFEDLLQLARSADRLDTRSSAWTVARADWTRGASMPSS